MHPRQGQVGIDQGAAMPGRVLAHRLHAGRQQAGGHGPPEPRHHQRIRRERTVADHVAGPRHCQVEHRRGGHVEAGGGAIQADQRTGEERGAQPGGRIAGEAATERCRRRLRPPVWRPQTRDPAALLIHHQHGIVWQDTPQRRDQVTELRRVVDVAREQDHPGWRVVTQQRRFFREERRAGDAHDGGLHAATIAHNCAGPRSERRRA